MKMIWIGLVACLTLGCQSDHGTAAKAGDDRAVVENKARKDADRDRRTQAVQEQWRGQVQH